MDKVESEEQRSKVVTRETTALPTPRIQKYLPKLLATV